MIMLKSRTFRIALATAITAVAMAAKGAHAQTGAASSGASNSWEFVVNSGTVVPTGVQRDAIKRGSLSAAQLSYVMHDKYAVTATFGWARSRDIAAESNPRLDVFTYDVGGEVRPYAVAVSKDATLRVFAGLGAGGRTYNYRSLDVDATHNLAGYGGIGGELGVKRVRMRVEARDYVTGFRPLNGPGKGDTRNDVAVMAGVRITSK
jgi:hypothetical protein